MSDRYESLAKSFHQHQDNSSGNGYKTAGEFLTVDEKLKVLEERGQADLIEIFKDWKPRVNSRRRKGAPLDQRVSITVTAADRAVMDGEVKAIKATGESVSLGNLIRSRAMGNLDVNGWRETASSALDELNDLVKNQSTIKKKKKAIELDLENSSDDPEQTAIYERELYSIETRLAKLIGSGEKRAIRLQGRMTFTEAETVKWRAQRLCLSTTDYLRIMIFGLEPNSSADAHLSVDARRRFWVSILDVADNGWGTPPGVNLCSQCESYSEEISNLREKIRQLEGN